MLRPDHLAVGHKGLGWVGLYRLITASGSPAITALTKARIAAVMPAPEAISPAQRWNDERMGLMLAYLRVAGLQTPQAGHRHCGRRS